MMCGGPPAARLADSDGVAPEPCVERREQEGRRASAIGCRLQLTADAGALTKLVAQAKTAISAVRGLPRAMTLQ